MRDVKYMNEEELKQEIRSLSSWLEDILEEAGSEEALDINIVADQRRLEELKQQLSKLCTNARCTSAREDNICK